MSDDSDAAKGDLGFTWLARRNGDVEVRRGSLLAVTLRGAAAARFLASVEAGSAAEAQQLMARVTGNYRRGNERTAGKHPRNRG